MPRASVRSPALPLLVAAAFAALASPRALLAQASPAPPELRIHLVERSVTIDLSRPPEARSVTVDTLPAPADSVWLALPEVYRALGVESVGQDPSTWTIGDGGLTTRRHLGKKRLSSYLRCGSTMTGPAADRYEVTLSILTQLEPLGTDRTVLRSSLDATATPRDRSGSAVHCGSRGNLEASIAGMLSERLGV